jgi:hypothetical protein
VFLISARWVQLRQADRRCAGCLQGIERLERAQPKEDAIRGAWWELFNDPHFHALKKN